MLGSDVHKYADAMVAFVSGAGVASGRTILHAKPKLSIPYNRGHLSWGDPLQLSEVLRQSVIASVHILGESSPDSAFVMERMLLTVVDDAPLAGDSVELHTLDEAVRIRASGSQRIVTDVAFKQGTRTFATGTGHLRVVSQRSYLRLRGAAAHATNFDLEQTSPSPVDLTRHGPQRRWAVRFNPRDPFFFDHPVDHVPGMLLFEAVRVAAGELHPTRPFAQFDGDFCRFVELDEDVHVVLGEDSGDGIGFQVLGSGERLAARGYVVLSPELS